MIAIDAGTIFDATKTDPSRWIRPGNAHADEKFDVRFYGRCNRWLCRPSCFGIAQARRAQALQTQTFWIAWGCAISALPGAPFAALREQFAEYRSGGSCTLIGGRQDGAGSGGVVQLRAGQICRPARQLHVARRVMSSSDNFGAIWLLRNTPRRLARTSCLPSRSPMRSSAGSHRRGAGHGKGLHHAIQLAISAAAGAGKLFGLTGEQIAHAISIATVDNISLTCVHVEPVSQWKGFSPGMTGMRAVYSASLAKRGFTGPSGLFEGPNGLLRMFDQKIDVDWSDDSLEIIKSTIMKKFCSLIHGQPVLEVVLKLKRNITYSRGPSRPSVATSSNRDSTSRGGGAFGSKRQAADEGTSGLQSEVPDWQQRFWTTRSDRPNLSRRCPGRRRPGSAEQGRDSSGRRLHRKISARTVYAYHHQDQRRSRFPP